MTRPIARTELRSGLDGLVRGAVSTRAHSPGESSQPVEAYAAYLAWLQRQALPDRARCLSKLSPQRVADSLLSACLGAAGDFGRPASQKVFPKGTLIAQRERERYRPSPELSPECLFESRVSFPCSIRLQAERGARLHDAEPFPRDQK